MGLVNISPGLPVALSLVILLAVTVAANRLGGIGLGAAAVLAGLRSIAQLGLAGLVITAVVGSIWWSLLAVAAMFTVAVFTTARRVEVPRSWPWAALAMACGVVPVMGIMLATSTIPFTGIALIPVAGIVLGNTMTAHTLVGRRVFAALREERGQYEAGLSIGLTAAQSIEEVIARRVPEGLIPNLDQVRTAGVVTLPGAFIGVMLGGGSAVQAATAQVLVLFAIMATQSVTAGVQARLIRARMLLPDDLRSTLVS